MQPKLLKTVQGQYEAAPWSGKNESGVTPLNDKIIVLMDRVSDKTAGGVDISVISERLNMASETGVIVACGDMAFVWSTDRATRWEGEKPVPGDRVIVERYAGTTVLGTDGQTYRVMDDKCVAARFEGAKA